MANDQSEMFSNVHQGRNIKRMRLQKGIKQEVLASELGMAQQTLSKLESKRVIEDFMLEKIAKVLQVPVEDLKTMEEPANILIENTNNNSNTYTNNDVVNNSPATVNNLAENNSQSHVVNQINPVDKIIELYERLMQFDKEEIKRLQQRLAELEGKKDTEGGQKDTEEPVEGDS